MYIYILTTCAREELKLCRYTENCVREEMKRCRYTENCVREEMKLCRCKPVSVPPKHKFTCSNVTQSESYP